VKLLRRPATTSTAVAAAAVLLEPLRLSEFSREEPLVRVHADASDRDLVVPAVVDTVVPLTLTVESGRWNGAPAAPQSEGAPLLGVPEVSDGDSTSGGCSAVAPRVGLVPLLGEAEEEALWGGRAEVEVLGLAGVVRDQAPGLRVVAEVEGWSARPADLYAAG
jgi:hypothetical protein